MVAVWPAIFNVPVRGVDPKFAATEKLIVPLPLPLEVVVIQAALLVAIQLQLFPVVIFRLPVLPPASKD
jgi:hypothetical protein